MMSLTLKQKREWAYDLFLRGELSQKEIAEKVGTSATTLSSWVKKFGWEADRKSRLVTKSKQLTRLYNQLDALNTKILNRQKDEQYASSSEADSMSKITASIKNLEKDIHVGVVCDVFEDFMNWLRTIDLEKAKEFIKYQDSYVKTIL